MLLKNYTKISNAKKLLLMKEHFTFFAMKKIPIYIKVYKCIWPLIHLLYMCKLDIGISDRVLLAEFE